MFYASEALDKIRYQALASPSVLDGCKYLVICIIPDKENKTLSIRDTGIGMTKADMVKNLGTNFSLGQSCVDLYPAYLVAERVQVISKHNNDEQYIWESVAGGTSTIIPDHVNPTLGRGTEIRLYLKEDQLECLEERRIKAIVEKHSECITYPIQLTVTKGAEKEVDSEEEEVKDNEEKPKNEVIDKDEDKRKIKKMTENEELTKTERIWTRNPQEITQDEYSALYKNLTNGWEDYLAARHFSVESQLRFKAIVFVSKRAPSDLVETKKKRHNIKLYVRSVFVMDDYEDLIPEYLNFVKGIVNFEDLPLNIARETLQPNEILKAIRKIIVNKCLDFFSEIATDKDNSSKFYKAFSYNIKLGIHEDVQNRTRLSEHLRFYSTISSGKMISLKEYVCRMSEAHHSIYYIVGKSPSVLEESPFLTVFKTKGFEVILVHPADQDTIACLNEYDGYIFVCVSRLKEPEAAAVIGECPQHYINLCEAVKDVFGDNNTRVIVSNMHLDVLPPPYLFVNAHTAWMSPTAVVRTPCGSLRHLPVLCLRALRYV
ncbi:hypothetical protein EIP86_002991 [Pleurotus ostreatoroseus]|nr:hypothetical protein EIP86_002991 [Pleurotus ostreatoroseus]